ncbi:hypothetical protein HanIR_Chr08g0382831 [Helianthus annuus]|nr:hypothetical protein HanIR_Chr08g0382831 [Helianthus annuus]
MVVMTKSESVYTVDLWWIWYECHIKRHCDHATSDFYTHFRMLCKENTLFSMMLFVICLFFPLL